MDCIAGMTTPENIPDAIDTNARGPKRVQVGNQSVDQHSIPDQIKADNHGKGETAKNLNHCGLRLRKLRPGGCG